MIDIIDDNPDKLLDQFLDSTQFFDVLEEDYFMEAYWELEDDEKQLAIDQVVLELQKLKDPRAPRFFRIAPVENCLEVLENVLPQAEGEFRFETVWTLMVLGEAEHYIYMFIDSLKDTDKMVRRKAARRVWTLDNMEFIPILFEMLYDEDVWVIYNALFSISILSDLPPYLTHPESNIVPILSEILSPFESIKEPAVKNLKVIVEGKLEGKTNEELGLFQTNPKEFSRHLTPS